MWEMVSIIVTPWADKQKRQNSSSGSLTRRSTLDSGEVGDRPRGGADFVEQLQPVRAQSGIVDVHRHFVEERIDMRTQLGHGPHGRGEVLYRDVARRVVLGDRDGARERDFLW